MDHLACFTPADLAGRTLPDLGAFRWHLLAQGDSWFSNARAKLNAHANLLQELVFKSPTAAVNCAGTGNALSHMVDLESSPDFVQLLAGAGAKALVYHVSFAPTVAAIRRLALRGVRNNVALLAQFEKSFQHGIAE